MSKRISNVNEIIESKREENYLRKHLKNSKGVTITSLTIYVIVATVIVTILVFLNANFFSNINDLTDKSNIVSECLNFKAAFLHDIKSENDVKVTDYNKNLIRLSNDVKYEIRVLDKNASNENKKYAVYRNDVQIAKSIVPHTQIDGYNVKEGPYFEYDINTNTLKVGLKFSDGKNVYIENESYIVGKEIQISWENSMNQYRPNISGDSNEPEVSPDITQNKRVYAVLYNDGSLIVTNHYRVDNSKVVLNDFGEMSATIENGNASWLSNKELIRTVNFAEKIEISNLANLFAGCTNLNEIRNTDNIKLVDVTSANSAFKDCRNLKTLNLSTWETDEKLVDMAYMFDGCESLTSLNLNALNTTNVTNMAGMVRGCDDLKQITLSNLRTDNVVDMSEMFSGCTSLVALDLSTFNTTSVQNLNNMFSECTSLNSLDISSFNTENVTEMDHLFYNCRSLNRLDIKNLNMSSITTLSNFFYNCANLTTIDFGTIDTSKVTDMSYLFANCTRLSNIIFGDFSTESVTNMESMFYNCQSLELVDLGTFETENVTNMSQLFAGCLRLTTIDDFINLDTSNVSNMSAMFQDCSMMRRLDLNNGVFTTEKVTTMASMFKGCGSLYELYVDGFDTKLVEDMSSMFEACGNLTELNLQYFDTVNATKMNRMFMNSSRLEKIFVGNDWNTKDREVDNMFEGCGTNVFESVGENGGTSGENL